MKTMKNRVLRAITSMVLIAAMTMGMAISFSRKADAYTPKPGDPGTYTVYFHGNTGLVIANNGIHENYIVVVAAGSYVACYSCYHGAYGSEFLGYSTSPYGNVVYPAGKPIRVMGNMHLYAKYRVTDFSGNTYIFPSR